MTTDGACDDDNVEWEKNSINPHLLSRVSLRIAGAVNYGLIDLPLVPLKILFKFTSNLSLSLDFDDLGKFVLIVYTQTYHRV